MMQQKTVTMSEKHIEDRMQSAVRTLKRLPPVKAKSYHTTWPSIIHNQAEILQMTPDKLKLRPSGKDITELEEVLFIWMPWLTIDERKLLWLRGARVPWKSICWQFGIGRTKAWEIYKCAIGKIASRL